MVGPVSHAPFRRSASRYTRPSPSALMSTRASVLPRSDGSRNSVASELRPKMALPAPMITILTGFMPKPPPPHAGYVSMGGGPLVPARVRFAHAGQLPHAHWLPLAPPFRPG